jgi:hypothetical protein
MEVKGVITLGKGADKVLIVVGTVKSCITLGNEQKRQTMANTVTYYYIAK